MRSACTLLLSMLLACGSAQALDLKLPANASMTREVIREADTLILPIGPYSTQGAPRLRLDGQIISRAWRFPAQGVTTLQILIPLRRQLEDSGWEVMFDCLAEECGGFDFRFALPVLPAPDMFIDLFDYRYLVARRGPEAKLEHVALIVSQSGQTGYVQTIQLTGLGQESDATGPRSPEVDDTSPPDVVQALKRYGHAVLEGLDFGSGDNALGPGPHPSLEALAAYLLTKPNTRVALVGHTDSTGGLEGNIALSRSRAEAVLSVMTEIHGVPATQLEAHGIGYLAPLAPNTTGDGRESNRRVEAVLLDTAAE